MSPRFKPEPLTLEVLVTQTHELERKKKELEESASILRDKAHRIEVYLKENEQIRQQVDGLLIESLGFFKTEWERKSSFYPEIRSQILQKVIDSAAKK